MWGYKTVRSAKCLKGKSIVCFRAGPAGNKKERRELVVSFKAFVDR
jgi:hypothetical protein